MSNTEDHISWYYKGKMPISEIELYLERFKLLFPKCKVTELVKDNGATKDLITEFTKESLINTCVVMESVAHAGKIVEFYKSFGLMGDVVVERALSYYKKEDVGMYIGLDGKERHGLDICYSWWPNCLPEYIKVIKLPSKPRKKFPREMLVSWDKQLWSKRTVIGKVSSKYPFVALHENQKPSDGGTTHVHLWPYAKEIKTD